QPAMGEEHLLTEACLTLGSDDLSGEAGEVRIARAVFLLPGERNEGGAAGLDREPELCSDAICEVGSAHLWNGETAGCDDQSAGAVVCRRGVNCEPFAMTDLGNVLIENDANAGRMAFRFEHRNDIACGAI